MSAVAVADALPKCHSTGQDYPALRDRPGLFSERPPSWTELGCEPWSVHLSQEVNEI